MPMTLRIVRRTLLGFIKYAIRKDDLRTRSDVALAFDVPNDPMSDRRRPYVGGMDSKKKARLVRRAFVLRNLSEQFTPPSLRWLSISLAPTSADGD